MFPLVIVAALMSGGVLWAFTRKAAAPSSVNQGTPDAIKPPAQTTAPGVAVTPVVTPPVVDTVAELSAQIAADKAQRALEQQKQLEADAARQRAYEIRGFQDRIGAIENLMKLDLVQLTSIERDDSKFADFLTQELRSAGVDPVTGLQGVFDRMASDTNPYWQTLVTQCKQTTGNTQACSSKVPDYGFRNPAAFSNFGNPAAIVAPQAEASYKAGIAIANTRAAEKVAVWKRGESLPAETRLSERERQYRGMVGELQRVYGVSYAPMDAEAQAAHARARV